MRIFRVVLPLLILLASGCPAPQPKEPPRPARPAWIDSGDIPTFPREGFMVAVGVGPSAQDAVKSARAEIANQIRVRVTSEVKTLVTSKQVWKGQGPADTQVQTEEMNKIAEESFAAEKLKGSEEKSSWNDGRDFYSFVVLSRPRFAEILRGDIARLDAEAARFHEAAKSAAGQVAALASLLGAYRAEKEAVTLDEALAVVATGAGGGGTERFAGFASTRTEIQRLVASLRIEKENDKQVAGFDAPLDAPLVLRVTSGGAAVAGFPFKFAFTSGAGRIEENTISTDASGRASCKVYATKRTGKRENGVAAAIDFGSIDPEDPTTIAAFFGDSAKVEFVYYLPTKAFTQVAFDIDEGWAEDDSNKNLAKHDEARARLAEVLSAAGYKTVDARKIPDGAVPRDAVKALSAKDKEYYYFIVEGRVRLISDFKPPPPQFKAAWKFRVRGDISLRVVDVSTDRVIAEIAPRELDAEGFSSDSLQGACLHLYDQDFGDVAKWLKRRLDGVFDGTGK